MATNAHLSALSLRSGGSRKNSAGGGAAWLARFSPLVGLLGALLCIYAVVVSAAGSPASAAFGRGLLELLIVGVPIVAGLYALRSPVNARLGPPLLAIGFLWSLTALAQTSASVPYTIGRLTTWCTLPGAVYLLLAFPDGQIAEGLDRVLLFGLIGVLVVLFFGTASSLSWPASSRNRNPCPAAST